MDQSRLGRRAEEGLRGSVARTRHARSTRGGLAPWAICLLALWVARSAAAAEPFRIGLLLPPEEARHESLRRGAETALALFNATSSVPARLVVRGRAGQWGDDADEAGRLVLDDNVRVMITPSGGIPTHLILQVAGRTQTPVVSLSPDGSVTTAGIPWMVRIVPSTLDEARLLLPAAAEWLPLVVEGRVGRSHFHDLGRVARELGRRILEPVVIPPGRLEATLESRWPLQPPRAIGGALLWLDAGDAARAATWLRRNGFTGVLAGPRALRESTFLAAAGPAGEGFLIADLERDSWSPVAVEAFATRYAAGTTNQPDTAALLAADAASLAAGLILRAGDRPAHELFPLRSPGGGLTGSWDFDASGNRRCAPRLYRGGSAGWQPAEAPR